MRAFAAALVALLAGSACDDGPTLLPHPRGPRLVATQELGPPMENRTDVEVYDILDDGTIYGSSRAIQIWHERATRWGASRQPEDLGITGDPDVGPGTVARGVNASGTFVGYRWNGGQAFVHSNGSRAYRADPGQPPTFLQGFGDFPSWALDINDAGVVVGCAYRDGAPRAVRWAPDGSVTELGSLGGASSCAFAISNDGWIVGRSHTAISGVERAFLWREGAGMIDLGTLGGSNSRAWGVNSAGQVVGESTRREDTQLHAFIWTLAGGMKELPMLPGGHDAVAEDINDAGDVVGHGWAGDYGRTHGILWRHNGDVVDLTELADGYRSKDVVSRATAIAPNGRVAGMRAYGTGWSVAMWTVSVIP